MPGWCVQEQCLRRWRRLRRGPAVRRRGGSRGPSLSARQFHGAPAAGTATAHGLLRLVLGGRHGHCARFAKCSATAAAQKNTCPKYYALIQRGKAAGEPSLAEVSAICMEFRTSKCSTGASHASPHTRAASMDSEKRALREARAGARVVGALFARSVASAQRPASTELAPAPRGGSE